MKCDVTKFKHGCSFTCVPPGGLVLDVHHCNLKPFDINICYLEERGKKQPLVIPRGLMHTFWRCPLYLEHRHTLSEWTVCSGSKGRCSEEHHTCPAQKPAKHSHIKAWETYTSRPSMGKSGMVPLSLRKANRAWARDKFYRDSGAVSVCVCAESQ